MLYVYTKNSIETGYILGSIGALDLQRSLVIIINGMIFYPSNENGLK